MSRWHTSVKLVELLALDASSLTEHSETPDQSFFENIKVDKTLSGGNLTMRLLTWDPSN
jgi:hypothetical protein